MLVGRGIRLKEESMTPDVLPFAQQRPTDDVTRLLDRVAARPDERIRALHHLLGEGPCRQLGIYAIPAHFKLSVVIPVYNERDWVAELVRRVQAVPIPKEIILVDDASTDGTPEILADLEANADN